MAASISKSSSAPGGRGRTRSGSSQKRTGIKVFFFFGGGVCQANSLSSYNYLVPHKYSQSNLKIIDFSKLEKKYRSIFLSRFDSELDKNGDNLLSKEEILAWIIPSNEDIADEEVRDNYLLQDSPSRFRTNPKPALKMHIWWLETKTNAPSKYYHTHKRINK